jgi:hypothetical protein
MNNLREVKSFKVKGAELSFNKQLAAIMPNNNGKTTKNINALAASIERGRGL